MPITAEELEVDVTARPFAVIYGCDHHSFPSALVNARELGIAAVLHLYTARGETGVFTDTIRLRHIQLGRITGPVSMNEREWLSQLDSDICSDIELPAFVGPIGFITGELQKYAGQLNPNFYPAMKATRKQYPEIRLLVIPGGLDGRIGSFGQIESKINMRPHLKTHTLNFSADIMHAVSPGHCRAHTFCVCDWKQRSVTWHRCE